jgi:hypothetical protein
MGIFLPAVFIFHACLRLAIKSSSNMLDTGGASNTLAFSHGSLTSSAMKNPFHPPD